MRTAPTGDLRPGRPRPRPWLRTARLNAVGYAALLAACSLAGVITAVVLRGTGWPLTIRAVIGAVAVLLALVGADRRKWSQMETSLSFTDDATDMQWVADRLAAQNLPVAVGVEGRVLVLRYRNGDTARVHAALANLGIRLF
jgi:hypothetical protein